MTAIGAMIYDANQLAAAAATLEDLQHHMDHASRLRGIRSEVFEALGELCMAHLLLQLALNHLQGDARRQFIEDACALGLDGEGVTRANEREAALARCGVTSPRLHHRITVEAMTDFLPGESSCAT